MLGFMHHLKETEKDNDGRYGLSPENARGTSSVSESWGSEGYEGRLRGPGLATQCRGTSKPDFRYPNLFLSGISRQWSCPLVCDLVCDRNGPGAWCVWEWPFLVKKSHWILLFGQWQLLTLQLEDDSSGPHA